MPKIAFTDTQVALLQRILLPVVPTLSKRDAVIAEVILAKLSGVRGEPKEEKLTASQHTTMKKLYYAMGPATAEQLGVTYIKIEPLIRCNFVRVSQTDGVAKYGLTEEGQAWFEANDLRE